MSVLMEMYLVWAKLIQMDRHTNLMKLIESFHDLLE